MKETSFSFGDRGHLVATLTTPKRSSTAPNLVAVLTNSGVIPRFGPNRMNVRLAREFAQIGIASIRFDLTGLGDSGKAGGQHTASEQWIRDTLQAIDLAEQQWGTAQFFMVGFCSGAEVAHLAALRDGRLRGAVLWDFLALPTWRSAIHTTIYKLHRAGWSGAANKLIDWVKHRIRPTPRPAAIQAPRPPIDEKGYINRFQTLCDQGVQLLFLYSGGEPEWYTYKHQFRDMFRGQAFVKQVEYDQIYISDHLISTQRAQDAFVVRLMEWVQRNFISAHE